MARLTSGGRPPAIALLLTVAVGVLAVSTAGVLTRFAMGAADRFDGPFAVALAAGRLLFAALLLGPAWVELGRSRGRTHPLAYGFAIAAGLLLALHFGCWMTSLAYTTVAASTVLVTTNPIWIALIQWLLGQGRPSVKTGLGIAVALAGSAILALGSGDATESAIASQPLLGNSLALVGAIAASGYLILGQRAQGAGLSIQGYAAIAYGTAAIALIPLPILGGVPLTGQPPAVYGWLVAMAVVPQVIGHTSLNWSMRWLAPDLVALAILFEPVGASLLAWLWLKEVPSAATGIGAIAIGTGVLLATRDR
ncbi:MAG: DMT family transporter [Cyanobacteria bacterium]|nr:DMT family transporter [Cyanobacteriota bacterium]